MERSQSKSTITPYLTLSLLLLLLASAPFSSVHAQSSYLTTWGTIYTGSTSNDASCQLCHASSTQNLNPYGAAVCSSNAGSISNRIQDVETANSDSDPTGSNNITEINASTQPGWTPGLVNMTYSRSTCSPTGNVEAPPTFIAAPLDPGTANQPPVADANGPYNGTINMPLSFDGSNSNDPDGTIVAYDWDFGDGNTGSGPTPSHTYVTDGTFNVSLTVTDDAGDTGAASTTATIGLGNLPPVSDPGGPYTGTAGTAVTFNGSNSSDPDGTIVAYIWDFGDGNTGSGSSPAHTYATAGTYNVSLTVTDDSGVDSTTGTTATISAIPVNQPPVADANGPYTGTAGTAVTFDGSNSSDPDGTIVAYDWDFGDGSSASGMTASHVYAADGNYTVTLIVTDDAGDTGMDETSASIGLVNQPPVADANGPYTGTAGMAVAFDASNSSDPDGTIVAYDWDFGDGSSGSGVTATHTYAADGSYMVKLVVTDDAGDTAMDQTTAAIGLGNQPPVADANGPYSGTVGVAVAFDGTNSNDPDGNIVAYSWDFGDGSSGSGATPSHTYQTDGTYNVTLTVTDNTGADNSVATTAVIAPVVTPPTPGGGDEADDDHDDGHDDDDNEKHDARRGHSHDRDYNRYQNRHRDHD